MALADRSNFENKGQHCSGWVCMAWRYESEVRRRFVQAEDPDALVEPPRPTGLESFYEWQAAADGEPAGWLEPVETARYYARGFCGLVGDPRSSFDQYIDRDIFAERVAQPIARAIAKAAG